MQYGVQKLVAINSGNYLLAELDLSKPVHLAAPNNRGKSTLVNALQFLYIDDFAKMRFGKRSLEDTSRHYFGDTTAYLIFECKTPTGIQCLLVRGLGHLRGDQFERYIYDGIFHESDFINESREIRGFDDLRERLADRHLARVRKSELWHVLGSAIQQQDGKAAPRLNILPIRKREEYEAFRDVFVKLLSLSSATARELKQLIIDSHARDLGERKIDIAADYREDFERIERSDRELRFLRSATELIDTGRARREEVTASREMISRSAATSHKDALDCYSQIDSEESRLLGQMATLRDEQETLINARDECLKATGSTQSDIDRLNREWDNLSQAREKWQGYTASLVCQMRRNLQDKNAEVVELERGLEHVAALDVGAMEQAVGQLKRRISADIQALQKWNSTAGSEIRRAGVADSDIEHAFRILNPDLLKLVVNETLHITDLDKTKARIRRIASHIDQDTFEDGAITANISEIPEPDESYWRDPDALAKRIAVARDHLLVQESRLRIARDRAESQRTLSTLQGERAALAAELSEYDQYVDAWSKRGELEVQRSTAKKAVEELDARQSELSGLLASNATAGQGIGQQIQALKTQKERLSSTVASFHSAVRRLNLDVDLAIPSANVAVAPLNLSTIESTIANLQALTAAATRMEDVKAEVRRLQTQITDKSRECEAQACYFGDEDEEWVRLIDGRESLLQREEANGRNWDALVRTLGARLNGMVLAMRNITLAVERLNAELKAYQVSNLRAVEIAAEKVLDIYAPLEALAGEGSLFQNRDEIDAAKLRLRRMIDSHHLIELPALFEIQIRTQLADGRWQHSGSLDEIGSTGTGMTAKAMIFVQLVRAVARDRNYRLHFYLDGLGELDDRNLSATTAMAVAQGITPITADPRLHLEPLANPEVTVYSLGQGEDGRFFIDGFRTYRARRVAAPESEVTL